MQLAYQQVRRLPFPFAVLRVRVAQDDKFWVWVQTIAQGESFFYSLLTVYS